MRKTLIALILVLPMAFVLVIFSSVNLVSLGVNISVNGIKIHAEGVKENTLFLDMAEKDEHIVTAEVLPSNATEKGYTLTSSDPAVVGVTKEGKIVPKREGTVEIIATSKDKSFTDSLSVVVVSSKPYDVSFSLMGEDGTNVLEETKGGYEAEVSVGKYSYELAVQPMGFTEYEISPGKDTYAEIEKGAKTLFLPFSGRSVFNLAVPNGVNGIIEKQITLNVTKPENAVLINGEVDFSGIQLTYGTTRAQLYVECSGNFSRFDSEHAQLVSCTNLKNGRYLLDIAIEDGIKDGFQATVIAGGKTVPFLFTFTDFDFSVFSDMKITTLENGGQGVTLLTGNAASFYAVSSGGAKDVTYTWEFSGPKEYLDAEGDTLTVKAQKGGEFVLKTTAKCGDAEITKEILLSVVKKISAIQIANNFKVDLAKYYTIAGMVYTDSLTLTENAYVLRVYTYSTSGMEPAGEDLEYRVSDEKIATVELKNGSVVLVPKSTGEVTVTTAWKGNEAFGASVKATITVNVVKDAVAVKNAPELVRAVGEKRAVVLTENIKLGTDANGNVLSLEERASTFGRMKSTYNIEWYKNTSDRVTEESSKVSYVMEFFNDVYGNGKSIDADNFTHALDASGKPLFDLYKGPLYFVKYKQMASVAGQDNCAFLVRTDGVKLYGVNLLGCSDESLVGENGAYDLTNLNLTGTTLEVNADAEIVNCRVRNGRNVVRAYGGNQGGDKYFINSLKDNAGCDDERIVVKIEGCILSQGREFILKMGANRALRASVANQAEPVLTDQSGNAYPVDGKSNYYGDLYQDEYFYKNYVMTDVTLKDSVVETSGLFTVGIESNFAGTYLFEGAGMHDYSAFTREWQRSGGTSFASVLRLEGDVRLYDWKDLTLVDSSTLIESPIGALSEWLKLDIQKMLDFVCTKNSAQYGSIIDTTSDGKQYVHGGIALYGGGRNYSAVDMTNLDESFNDFLHLNVNISVLADADGAMSKQGTLLPKAAGTQDFNFYMYGKDSQNNYAKQRSDEQRGIKYAGLSRASLFDTEHNAFHP